MQIEGELIRDPGWVTEVEALSGISVSACYQCKKCSNGCPVVYAMDFQPNRLIRMIQLGLKEEVLQSSTIWICAACETCFTRCPNDINIPKVMDCLRQMAERAGMELGEKRAPVFHEAFLASIRKRGRIHELGMIQQYTLKTGDLIGRIKNGELIQDAKLGWEMFKRGKLRIIPQRIKGLREVKNIFKRENIT